MPLFRRLPKRGFSNANFARHFTIINVCQLERFPGGSCVDLTALCQAGLVSGVDEKVKVLGGGELNRPLIVQADKFSRSARQKITSAGGEAQELLRSRGEIAGLTQTSKQRPVTNEQGAIADG